MLLMFLLCQMSKILLEIRAIMRQFIESKRNLLIHQKQVDNAEPDDSGRPDPEIGPDIPFENVTVRGPGASSPT